ncbi:MAG: helix-turn-helix domain-containing protein [Lachnospiraceae bacterium]|nr:helix-turn-helix domain-containing protein [Lachnospiraceae bacterium]
MNYYQIADAAKKVNVESHVLRYWEEELQLPIERNKQGHRLYTDEDLNRFLYIKELKKEGLQLRAIRTKVHMKDKQPEGMAENGKWVQEKPQDKALLQEQAEKHLPECGERSAGTGQVEEEKTRKAARLCMMLQQMVVTAVHEENEGLLREIKKGVAETVSKEMNYQFSIQEQREEEHYKKLDEILRERERRNRMTLGDRKRLRREHQRAEREKLRAEKESARREKEKAQQEQARMEKEKLQKEKENARMEKEKLQKEKESARKEKEKLQKEKEQARREREKAQHEQARMEKEKLRQEREHARKAKEKIQQAKARGSLFGSREKNRQGQEQQEGLS